MIVECPRCHARYRVADDVVAEEPTFKCSRCDNLFGAEGRTPPEPAAESPREDPEIDDEDVAAREEEATESFDEPDEPEPPAAPAAYGTRRRGAREAGNLDLPFATAPEAEDVDSDVDRSEENDRPAASSRFDFREDDDRYEDDAEDEPEEDDRGGVSDEPRFLRSFSAFEEKTSPSERVRRPFLIFLAVLLLFYGNLALYFRNHAEAAERALASVPLFGRLLVENRLLQSRVYLRDLEGVFQRIKDGRTVFIVSGRAVNTAEAAVKGVEVESALYGGDGDVVATKSIFCGNAMSLKIVKDLSSKEISILQRLQPPQRFEIAPGDAAGFSVVFLDPPEGFSEFSARVATAQPALS